MTTASTHQPTAADLTAGDIATWTGRQGTKTVTVEEVYVVDGLVQINGHEIPGETYTSFLGADTIVAVTR